MTRARHNRRLARLEAIAATQNAYPINIDVTGLEGDALRTAAALEDKWQSSREAQRERGLTEQPIVSSYHLWRDLNEDLALEYYDDFTTIIEDDVLDRISGGDPTRPFFLLRTFTGPAGSFGASRPVVDFGGG